MGRFASLLLLALVVYAGSYGGFRQTNQGTWQKDGKAYVLFPSSTMGKALYYLWRPLSYADGALTGMRFHIGQHRR
jgi:hypothetical protein